jgi:hypothetical protein
VSQMLSDKKKEWARTALERLFDQADLVNRLEAESDVVGGLLDQWDDSHPTEEAPVALQNKYAAARRRYLKAEDKLADAGVKLLAKIGAL